jgi:hypothetical protein
MNPDTAFQVNPDPDPMHKGCPNYRGSPPLYGSRSQIRIRMRIENSVTDPDCKTGCGYESRDPTEGITVKAGNVVTFGAQNNFFLRISFR